jgi:hypothetical protein
MSAVKMLQLVAFSAFTVAALGSSPGSAQTTVMPGFSAQSPSSVPGCPYIVWRLARQPDGRIHGMAYYSDLSGTSNVTGQRDANGDFKLNVTATSEGSGPVGTITGHAASDGSIRAKMVGQGCANTNDMTFNKDADLNAIITGG